MNIATKVYKRYLKSHGFKKTLWSAIRKALTQLMNDPTCSLKIHGRRLKIPLSHELPNYLKQFPLYDQLPRRIGAYVHQSKGHISCIDVGANIGDTIAAFYQSDYDTFLAIEPNPKFYSLLVENWGWNKNVTVLSDICSSGNDVAPYSIVEKKGTASIIQSIDGRTANVKALDELVKEHSCDDNANILKIDTDGHDFKVIDGAKDLLAHYQPALLFECDAFGNVNYVEECLQILKRLKTYGYHHFLLYDNFGCLLGKFPTSNLDAFKNLLFYQLTSKCRHFDILCMQDKDILIFYRAEINFYTQRMSNKALQRTAISATLS